MRAIGVRLVDNKEKVIAALEQQAANGLNNAGAFFVSEARANASIDTGFMQSHVLMAESEMATPHSLSTTVRSLALYSWLQDQGIHGNLFFTRAWVSTRLKFKQFLVGAVGPGQAGSDIIGAALEDFHGPLGNPRSKP